MHKKRWGKMYKSAKYIKNIDIKIRKWYIFNKENNLGK